MRRFIGRIFIIGLVFLGQKEVVVVYCDTELNIEQVSYETSEDVFDTPPDSVLQQPVIMSITAHIVRRSNGSGGISEEVVLKEVERLSQAFAPANMAFEVCTFNYINDNKFYNLTKFDEARLITYDIENTINIYFVNQISSAKEGRICGYTYYPTKNLDNVFMANACVPQGTTLIHELGHFFGLYHTHEVQFGPELVSGANCSAAGDLICDTPADPGLSASLISDACEFTGFVTDVFNTAYTPPVRNYMSYSRQRCRDSFTQEQLYKMRLNYHYFKTHIKTLNTSFEVSDSVVLRGDTLKLYASGGIEYWWSTGDTTQNISVVPDSSTTYSVNIVTDNGCNVFKKYAVEVIRDNFIETPPPVCEGESATIVLNHTKRGYVYLLTDLYDRTIYTSIGNGGTIFITTNVLDITVRQRRFAVAIFDPATEQYWQLKETFVLKVVPQPRAEETQIEVLSDIVCQGDIGVIRIPSSDSDMYYQLMVGDQMIGTPKIGNRHALTLLTAPIDTATTYHLRIYNACREVIKNNIVSFIPREVPNFDTLTYALSAKQVLSGDRVAVQVEASNPDLSYQLLVDDKLTGRALSGNDKQLVLQTPAITQPVHLCLVVNDVAGCNFATIDLGEVTIIPSERDLEYSLVPGNLLEYTLREEALVTLVLYALDGNRRIVIHRGRQKKGSYQYVLQSEALNVPPGNYMVRWQVGEIEGIKRIISIH